MQEKPSYDVTPFPPSRRVVLDVLRAAGKRYPVHALVEYDVTEARRRMAVGADHVSWTGFVVATLGRAVAEHPELNCRLAGRRLVCFSSVDVAATVEHTPGEAAAAPTPVTVRSADRKSAVDITVELHHAKLEVPAGGGGGLHVLGRLPGPVRRRAIRVVASTPRGAASFGPCVGVTSLGMFVRGGGWAVPIAPLTLVVTVGAVVERPVARDGQVVVRPQLPLTLTFDHTVVDGAPAARFAGTFQTLIESAAVLAAETKGERHGHQPVPLPR